MSKTPPWPETTIFASLQDELDQDHFGYERITPAGSLWEVLDVEVLTYPSGKVWHYTLGCPATGAAINPYTPVEGEPFGHSRDEMRDFVPVELPPQVWATLRTQAKGLAEIKDAVIEVEHRLDRPDDPNEALPPDGDSYNEVVGAVKHWLKQAKVWPECDV